jgi:hypothetical protein
MKNISATKIQTYEECPLRYYYNYELGLLQLPNPAFILGTAYHKAVELLHSDKDEELIKKEIKTIVNNNIEYFSTVMGLLRNYMKHPVTGTTIEREFMFSQAVPFIPVPLFGFIDRIDENKIVEYKTTSTDYTQKDTDTLQSKIYTYAVWKKKGKMLPVYYSVNNKKKIKSSSYKPQLLKVEHKEEDMKQLEEKLLNFYNIVSNPSAYKLGMFYPRKGDHCFWCPYGKSGTKNCNC